MSSKLVNLYDKKLNLNLNLTLNNYSRSGNISKIF
jgi:hypothetical protein